MQFQTSKIDKTFLGIIFLIVFFLTGCQTGKDKPPSSEPEVLQQKSNAIKEMGYELADKLAEELESEFIKYGPGPVVLDVQSTDWNTFLDRLELYLKESLGNKKMIKMVRPDWDFVDEVFTSLQCPKDLLLPEYKVVLTVERSKAMQEFLAVAELRCMNSKRELKTITYSLKGKAYQRHLPAWEEEIIRSGPNKGSRENPFNSVNKMSKFLARLISCKMKTASKIWNKTTDFPSQVNFRKLSYKMLGLRPRLVSEQQCKHLKQSIYQALINSGIRCVANERDMEDVVQLINKYDRFEPYYRKGKQAGKLDIATSEAVIVGDASRVRSGGPVQVSLRTVIITRSIDGQPGQGFVIPALGGNCFIQLKQDPISINLKRLRGDDFYIKVNCRADIDSYIRHFSIMDGGKRIFPNNYCPGQTENYINEKNEVTLDFQHRRSIVLGGKNSCFHFHVLGNGKLQAQYNYNNKAYSLAHSY